MINTMSEEFIFTSPFEEEEEGGVFS